MGCGRVDEKADTSACIQPKRSQGVADSSRRNIPQRRNTLDSEKVRLVYVFEADQRFRICGSVDGGKAVG